MEITKSMLEDLYIIQGLSTKEISNLLGIGKTTVNTKLKKYDIPIKNKKEAQANSMKKYGENIKAKNTASHLKCKNCNKDIYIKKSLLDKAKNHFCSTKCSTTYYSLFREKNGEMVECDYCKTLHYKTPYLLKSFDKHFCNKECHGKWLSENNSGKNNSRYNRIIIYCAFCGEELMITPYKYRLNKQYHYCNKDCMSNHYIGLVYGENHPSWKGGYSNLYYGPNWKKARYETRKRDSFACQRCGVTEESLNHALPVHHIKPLREHDSWEEANKLSNLISLCPKCHGTVEQNGMDFEIKIV